MDPELVEILAEQSHIGWMKQRQSAGFADHVLEPIDNAEQHHRCSVPAPGQYQDRCWFPPSQHHPDMKPYADLSEETKEYDRVTVRGVLDGIEAAGYIVSKRLAYHLATT